MQIDSAKFILSMAEYQPTKVETIPQIAVVGKSNVGKSSFINMITRQNKLCKIGKTPGKTRLINWFLINDEFYLVDLPGYGYAKRPKSEIESWGRMIENYLLSSEQLQKIILLLDIRHMPTGEDRIMFDWITHYGIEPLIICTKAEKIAKSKRNTQCSVIAKDIGYHGKIYPVDSVSGYGRDKILEILYGGENEQVPKV